MPRFSRLLAVTALVGGLTLAAGCSSTDRHVFESPLTHPVTVSVIDVATNKPLWRMPVPPGEKLIVNLDRDSSMGGTTAEAVPANKLSWELYHEQAVTITRGYPLGDSLKSGKTTLPGTPIRLNLIYTKPNEQPKAILPSQQSAAAHPEQETTVAPAQESTAQPAAQGQAMQESTSEAATPPAPPAPPASPTRESTAQEQQSPTMNSDEGDAASSEQSPAQAPAQTQPQPEQTTAPAESIAPETTTQPATKQPEQSNDQIMFK